MLVFSKFRFFSIFLSADLISKSAELSDQLILFDQYTWSDQLIWLEQLKTKKSKVLETDRQTDRPTDRKTDRPTFEFLDLRWS